MPKSKLSVSANSSVFTFLVWFILEIICSLQANLSIFFSLITRALCHTSHRFAHTNTPHQIGFDSAELSKTKYVKYLLKRPSRPTPQQWHRRSRSRILWAQSDKIKHNNNNPTEEKCQYMVKIQKMHSNQFILPLLLNMFSIRTRKSFHWQKWAVPSHFWVVWRLQICWVSA